MRPGRYKHRSCRDVAMEVVKSFWIPEKRGWKVRIFWINIVNPKNPFVLIPQLSTEFVSKDQLKNWKEIGYRAGV